MHVVADAESRYRAARARRQAWPRTSRELVRRHHFGARALTPTWSAASRGTCSTAWASGDIVTAAPDRFGGLIRWNAATYVLPIRRSAGAVDASSPSISPRSVDDCELIVVDGSIRRSFDATTRHGRGRRHVRPDAAIAGRNGKVRGVLTGVALASHERVVIADDDVRYDRAALERTIACSTTPTSCARRTTSLRSCGTPGGTRRERCSIASSAASTSRAPSRSGKSTSAATGGYDGDVLFENLELIRTVEAAGGRVLSPPDLYVRRLPPSTAHFWSQRVRQAYDEFARPWRLVAYLVLAPLAAWALARRRRRAGRARGRQRRAPRRDRSAARRR